MDKYVCIYYKTTFPEWSEGFEFLISTIFFVFVLFLLVNINVWIRTRPPVRPDPTVNRSDGRSGSHKRSKCIVNLIQPVDFWITGRFQLLFLFLKNCYFRRLKNLLVCARSCFALLVVKLSILHVRNFHVYFLEGLKLEREREDCSTRR